MVSHPAPVYTHNLFKVVSYTTNPVAGEVMAFFCAVVIRGGRKPFVVDVKSKIDEAFAALLAFPILNEPPVSSLANAAPPLFAVLQI